MEFGWLAVNALAAYRITRFIQQDTFPPVKAFRAYVWDRWSRSLLAEAIECPWCLGFWIAIGVIAADHFATEPWRIIASVLATSAVIGLISDRELT